MADAAHRQSEPRSLQHYDEAAEAAVLSAVMLKREMLDEVRDLLEPQDFFNGAHRTVFEAVLALDASDSPTDIVTIAHHLRNLDRLKQVGGSPFLASLIDATPAVAHVLEHARLVRRLAHLRRMGLALTALSAEARQVETRADVPGFLERCEAAIFAVAGADFGQRETASPLGDVMAGLADALNPSRPREPRGTTTGMHELDLLTLGFGPGELWYIAARPGIGKTALALGMSQAVAATGGRTACFFSLEMKRTELGERLVSAMSGVPYKAIQKRELSMAYYERAMNAAVELGRLPMVIDDLALLTPSRLRSRARKHIASLRAKHPHARPGIIVVDYVQLMADDSAQGNRNDQLERISRSLKILAGELGVAVVALSQLNRPKDRGNARPSLTDLRGSGALEQDADKVLFVHRDEAEGDERGDAELILGKGRNAGTGRVRVTWQPWCVRFTDSTQEGFAWQDPGSR